jgi:hypothetical protein
METGSKAEHLEKHLIQRSAVRLHKMTIGLNHCLVYCTANGQQRTFVALRGFIIGKLALARDRGIVSRVWGTSHDLRGCSNGTSGESTSLFMTRAACSHFWRMSHS